MLIGELKMIIFGFLLGLAVCEWMRGDHGEEQCRLSEDELAIYKSLASMATFCGNIRDMSISQKVDMLDQIIDKAKELDYEC